MVGAAPGAGRPKGVQRPGFLGCSSQGRNSPIRVPVSRGFTLTIWRMKNEGRRKMDSRKNAILAAIAALIFTTASAFGQAKSETTKQDRANVFLRFDKEQAISANCSQILGLITQSMLQVEGVRNVKIDAKNNGLQVSYDPSKTTPQKIVAAFNKENPDSQLKSSEAKEAK